MRDCWTIPVVTLVPYNLDSFESQTNIFSGLQQILRLKLSEWNFSGRNVRYLFVSCFTLLIATRSTTDKYLELQFVYYVLFILTRNLIMYHNLSHFLHSFIWIYIRFYLHPLSGFFLSLSVVWRLVTDVDFKTTAHGMISSLGHFTCIQISSSYQK